ncbi:unnamed protein product [Durusdinium trenchii]|uniref:SCP2 domain-containing protein n=1 Tax=Durusdinium trenchii TaxID=1381693 RepID=A0ABP0T256_9DINO
MAVLAGDGLLCRPLLASVDEALEKYGESLVRQCGYVYQFHLKDGGERGNFTLDLKNGRGSLRVGYDPRADVFISMLDEDMVALGKGTLSIFNALRDGRLQIKGDQLASQVLVDVMQRIERTKRNDVPKAVPQSDESTKMWRFGAVLCFLVIVVLAICIVNPWEIHRSAGGPREMEILAHMSQGNLWKLNNGIVKKMNTFTMKAFKTLFPMKKAVDVIPSDVFLVGSLGTGTTWLSHIMHGLRSGGSMSFEDIWEVVAWYDSLAAKNVLSFQTNYAPRLFMSHRIRGMLPTNARYVVLMRDPLQVVQSQYDFFCNSSWAELAGLKRAEMHPLLFTPTTFASVTSNEFWLHILSWYTCCWKNPEVLWITYEDFVDDPASQIRMLGKFLQHPPGAELLKKLVHQSSRSFMLEHESKFDCHSLLDQFDVFQLKDGSRARLPRVADDASMQVDSRIVQLLEVRWTRIVTPVTGFKSYAEMRTAIQQRALPGGAYGWTQSGSNATSHLLFVMLLLLGLLAAFIGLQPTLSRSLATRLWILARTHYRRTMSHFSDSKKMDPEIKAARTGTGFVV